MTKPFVFTLMPFDSDFDDVYQLGIKAACENEGAYCERVDEQIFQGSILDRITNQICKADVIVADMSGKSPNVFFEVGYAKALGKKVILLTSRADDIPFDLKHYAHIVYDESIVKLKETLENQLRHYFSNPEKTSYELLHGVEAYILGVQLIENEIIQIKVPQNYNFVPLVIKNTSGKTFERNSVQVVASGDDLMFAQHADNKYLESVQGNESWAVFNETPIFPGGTDTFKLCNPPKMNRGSKYAEISVFTSNGQQNYSVELLPIESSNK